MTIITKVTCIAASFLYLSSLSAAEEPAAASDAAPGKTVSCVRLSQIDSTQVVDDRTIIFRMRSGKPRYYKNTLPYKCPQLGFEKAFSYKTSTNQLCSVDIITVLQNFGSSFNQGSSCGLGDFVPYQPPVKAKKN
jgi:hypothetical protein